MKMIKFTLWLKDHQLKAMRELANRTEEKVSWHIRKALDQYIKKENKK